MKKLVILPILFAALLLGSGLAGQGDISQPDGAEAVNTTVNWGYFTVAGFDDTPQNCIGAGAPCNGLALPCTDCFITSVTPDLEYRTVDNPPIGTTGPEDTWVKAEYSNGAMLHHFVIGNYAQPDATCGNTFPISIFGDRFFASGDERGHDDAARRLWLLHPTLRGAEQLVEPPGDDPQPRPVDKNLQDSSGFCVAARDRSREAVEPCLARCSQLSRPPNSPCRSDYSDTHADWTSGSVAGFTADDVEGTVLAIGGHVHDLGISVAAQKVQTGQWICSSTAEYAVGSAFDPPAAASPPQPE